jgi:hypothetical protein
LSFYFGLPDKIIKYPVSCGISFINRGFWVTPGNCRLRALALGQNSLTDHCGTAINKYLQLAFFPTEQA